MYSVKSFYIYVSERPADYGNNEAKLDAYALQVKSGNFAEFDEIDRELRPIIRRMTFKYDMNEYDREDLIQEMLLSALMLCLRFDYSKGHYGHYALRSIRLKMYSCVNYLSVSRQIEICPEEVYMLEHRHALSHVILKEAQEEYAGAVGNLSNFEKRVLKLFMGGATFDEIGSIINKEPESVINTLYRIKFKFSSVEDLHAVIDNDALSRYSILELK